MSAPLSCAERGTLMNTFDISAAYDAAFVAQKQNLMIRAEDARDTVFLMTLFMSGSPLRVTLPPTMLSLQAELQQRSYRDTYPRAMRRIVSDDTAPIARIMIDWSPADHSLLVDIAVTPEHQRRGIGLALLRAWIEVADTAHRSCQLSVLADNPARLLYERLDFRVNGGDAPPFLRMGRAVGG